MTTLPPSPNQRAWWNYWPCALAGLGVPLALFLVRWLPPHFAAGVAFFVTWFVAGLLLARYFRPKWGLPAWVGALAAAVAAGITAGTIAYLIHWP